MAGELLTPAPPPPSPTAASHRDIVALAVPAMGALAADPLLSLVDTAIAGRLGRAELAALGVDTAIFTTAFWLLSFLTYGTTAQVAPAARRRRPRRRIRRRRPGAPARGRDRRRGDRRAGGGGAGAAHRDGRA